MLPSPARRCSPGREFRVEKNHKRGRSADCEILYKNKDEDLTLFTDMQTKEKDNLILSNEDFDESLAKLKCATEYPFGLSVHIRRGSNDLLVADSEKNDYEWLLTPPDTPLFPYLDDDDPPPANLSSTRGRQKIQASPTSRSSVTEKNPTRNRSSASPHRLSPSPRSGNGAVPSRGRSSTAQSSPIPSGRPTTPSRRSPTPNKPSSPTPRSSTPTFRRLSVDSSLQASSSGRRGNSPMKGSRGSSASPKLQGWQPGLPGFSSEAPPNLRTSLSDRPNSFSRGSSPASRNGRARQSMSPTASRSASSSYSHDIDRSSPHSKDSSVSFADEDVDSLPSISRGDSSVPVTRKNGAFASNKSLGFSTRPSRTITDNSTPKRSLDLTLRQMEQHKTPQNMFRPLLSSAPISSFYIGKANAMHRPVFSRNSSLTTSSNASSELGASVAPEYEGIEQETIDNASEWDKVSDSLLHEEGFLGKMDGIKEDIMHDLISEKSLSGHEDFDMNNAEIESEVEKSHSSAEPVVHPFLPNSPCNQPPHLEGNLYQRICSMCRNTFTFAEPNDPNVDVCKDCAEKAGLSGSLLSMNGLLNFHGENFPNRMVSNASDECCDGPRLVVRPVNISEEIHDTDMPWQQVGRAVSSEQSASQLDISEKMHDADMPWPQGDSIEQSACKLDNHSKLTGCLQESHVHLGKTEHRYNRPGEIGQPLDKMSLEENSSLQLVSSEKEIGCLQGSCVRPGKTEHRYDQLGEIGQPLDQMNLEENSSLQLVSSEKEHAHHEACNKQIMDSLEIDHVSSQSQSAGINSNLKVDCPEGTGISLLLKRSSSNKGPLVQARVLTASNLQYVDRLEPTHARESTDIVRANISRNSSSSSSLDMGLARPSEVHAHRQRSSSKSEFDNHLNALSLVSHAPTSSPVISMVSTENPGVDYFPESERTNPSYECLSSEEMECDDRHFPSSTVDSAGESTWTDGSMHVVELSASSMAAENAYRADYSATLIQTDNELNQHDDSELENSKCSIADKDEFANAELQISGHNDNGNSNSTRTSFSSTTFETPNCGRTDCVKIENEDYRYSGDEAELSISNSLSLVSEKELSSSTILYEEGIPEVDKSTATEEGSPKQKSKCLTATEEADAILFCSSIVDDLAYQAATIGIEKEESSVSKFAHLTVAVLEKSVPYQRERTRVSTRHTTAQRVKKNTPEADVAMEQPEPLKGEKLHDSLKTDPIPHHRVETPKPPSKCNCAIM